MLSVSDKKLHIFQVEISAISKIQAFSGVRICCWVGRFLSFEESYCFNIHDQMDLDNLYIPLWKHTTIVNRTHAILHKSVFITEHRLMQHVSALITVAIRYYHSETPWGKILLHKLQVGIQARYNSSKNIQIKMTAKTWKKYFVKNIIKNVASTSANSCIL